MDGPNPSYPQLSVIQAAFYRRGAARSHLRAQTRLWCFTRTDRLPGFEKRPAGKIALRRIKRRRKTRRPAVHLAGRLARLQACSSNDRTGLSSPSAGSDRTLGGRSQLLRCHTRPPMSRPVRLSGMKTPTDWRKSPSTAAAPRNDFALRSAPGCAMKPRPRDPGACGHS